MEITKPTCWGKAEYDGKFAEMPTSLKHDECFNVDEIRFKA
jgi:hypothetical protein